MALILRSRSKEFVNGVVQATIVTLVAAADPFSSGGSGSRAHEPPERGVRERRHAAHVDLAQQLRVAAVKSRWTEEKIRVPRQW